LAQAHQKYKFENANFISLNHNLLWQPIYIAENETDERLQLKLATHLQEALEDKNEGYQVVHVNTLSIGPLAASRPAAITSQADHKGFLQQHLPDNKLLFSPTNPLTCYNWQTPAQVLFHLISHPEEREELRQEAKRRTHLHTLPQIVQICHPLLPHGILIHPNITDMVLLRILHGLLWTIEGLWLIIPELEFQLPEPCKTSFWGYRKL
jgi:hypothetical protein